MASLSFFLQEICEAYRDYFHEVDTYHNCLQAVHSANYLELCFNHPMPKDTGAAAGGPVAGATLPGIVTTLKDRGVKDRETTGAGGLGKGGAKDKGKGGGGGEGEGGGGK